MLFKTMLRVTSCGLRGEQPTGLKYLPRTTYLATRNAYLATRNT